MLDVGSLPSAEVVQQRVNERYDELFHVDNDGKRRPYVCVICDEFIIRKADNNHVTVAALKQVEKLLSWTNIEDERRSKELENQYTVTDELLNKHSVLKKLALSPRGVYYKKPGRGFPYGFSCCKRCKGCVERKVLPRHAIVNKNYIGSAPPCLAKLTIFNKLYCKPSSSLRLLRSLNNGRM